MSISEVEESFNPALALPSLSLQLLSFSCSTHRRVCSEKNAGPSYSYILLLASPPPVFAVRGNSIFLGSASCSYSVRSARYRASLILKDDDEDDSGDGEGEGGAPDPVPDDCLRGSLHSVN